MFYASNFSNGSGAFRETGALRFFFIPKGALTHHRPQAGGGSLPVGLAVRSARRIALSAESARQCCRDCGPDHHCLRGGNGAPFPPPAKTCHRQFYRSAGSDRFARSCFLFCERETERLEVKTIGNLPSGSEGHQPRHGPLRLRGFGLHELLRHLQ